jgi:DNA-binding response OmpR family regulator
VNNLVIKALRLGANAMLKEPMNIAELRSAVARCLVERGDDVGHTLDCVGGRHPVERPEVIAGTGL